MTDDVIVAQDLRKQRGTARAVDGVSLTVRQGELFGLIGPDGAGKTTFIRILATLLTPDQGSATVLGRDVVRDLWAIRPRLGYMPGRFSLYGDLSVRENLDFYAAVFGTTLAAQHDQIAPIWSQLEQFSGRRAAALSGGMKQKLALCCALVHRPDLLLLDEPTTGVDAVSRREFWDLLTALRAGGLTILVSTPYMDEAVRCDRVALMQQGRLLAVDTPARISHAYPYPLFAVRTAARVAALAALRAIPTAAGVWPFGDTIHYSDRRPGDATEAIREELLAVLHAGGVQDATVAGIAPGIEDAFIQRMSEIAA